ncbi:MAG: TMEM143 family protein [Planctomycetota bacterium]
MNIKNENFIPFQKEELIEICCSDGKLNLEQQQHFRDFCHILAGYYHFKYFHFAEKLKKAYFPFNPDRDIRSKRTFTPEQLKQHEKDLLEYLRSTLEKANYEEVSREDLDAAMKERSLFKIDLNVDFDDFTQFLVFKRGEHPEIVKVKKFFHEQELKLIDFERVVLYIQFKDAEYFKSKGKRNLMFEPGSTILKLFKNIPKADIEMLFPNAETRMSGIDKVVMGLPAGLGAIPILMKALPALSVLIGIILTSLGIWEVHQEDSNKMIATIQGLIGLGILSAFLFRQFMRYKNKKLAFAKALSDNLYFRNLDNNGGVFFHLIDSAEEEESKEAILAYYFLMVSEKPLTEEQLDQRVETWFQEHHQIHIDFEVDDALHKLHEIGLSEELGTAWTVLSLGKAKERIDYIWDHIFSYNNK